MGPLTFRLAREFGFCYGVDRAVEYAYETRTKFPGRRLFLVGEIIHNPHVNQKLRDMGITLLAHRDDGEFDFSGVTPDDVVIMPAFGVTIRDFERLRAIGCVLVDTTCGSVLNVWKRVESYARDGFTAIIHGKHYHEETKATASQVMKYPGGRYLVVFDMAEARLICDFIEGKGNSRRAGGPVSSRGLARLRLPAGPGPGWAGQPDHHAVRRVAGHRGGGAEEHDPPPRSRGGLGQHFRSFDTICSATQERQDAVLALLQEPLDVMVVVGGYNSSNTCHLAALVQQHGITAYHIEDADAVDVATGTIRHQPIGTKTEAVAAGWLGSAGSHRDHSRCLDTEQQGGRDDRANQRGGRGGPRGSAWVSGEAGKRVSGASTRRLRSRSSI